MAEVRHFMENEYWVKTVEKVRVFLEDLRFEYPEHEKWYNGMVQELKNKKNRDMVIAYDNKKIIGVSILKKEDAEKKICSIRVAKEYQKIGIGTELVKRSLDILETDKPIITVSQSKKEEFKKIFEFFGFSLETIYNGKYLPCSKEYCYNGILLPEKILKKDKEKF